MATYSVHTIATMIDAEVISQKTSTSDVPITGIGTLHHGGRGQIGFLAESQYQKFLATTELSAVIVDSADLQATCDLLLVREVKRAWRQVVNLFAPQREFSGIHPQAIIDAKAQIAAQASIGAGAIIGQGCSIAQHCIIEAGATIGCNVRIGEGSYIASGVHIGDNTVIGNNAYINSGAIIGSRGFGFSYENDTWQPIAQLGHVVIGDDVEIGANTTIDRGAVDDTVIGDGVKLDNLIQIGHNVVIGEHTIIAGCCVIAGSTTIGKHCMIAGASVLAGHINICDYAQITGHSSISKSIREPDVFSSAIPAMPNKQWNRFVANLRRLNKK